MKRLKITLMSDTREHTDSSSLKGHSVLLRRHNKNKFRKFHVPNMHRVPKQLRRGKGVRGFPKPVKKHENWCVQAERHSSRVVKKNTMGNDSFLGCGKRFNVERKVVHGASRTYFAKPLPESPGSFKWM